MNILPKKRWHVRTKENIARVRRDEALAAEQAKIEQARIDKAESEARINILRNESRKKYNANIKNIIDTNLEPKQSTSSSKHINFFEELEEGGVDHTKSNKDFEKEKKEEQEKYEKQIGLLTYLGQGVKEAVSKSWYNEVPRRINDSEKNIEVKPNKKALEDPVQDIKKYLNIISVKNKNKPNVKLEKNVQVSKEDIKVDKKEIKVEGYRFKCEDVHGIDRKKKRKSSNDDSSEDNYKIKKKHKSSTRDFCDNDHKSHKKYKSSTESDSSEDGRKSHKKYKKRKKHKKSKKHKKEKDEEEQSGVDIAKLRAERLEREKREKLRAQALLAEVKGQRVSQEKDVQPAFKQKYNSQFFPTLARQNCEKVYR